MSRPTLLAALVMLAVLASGCSDGKGGGGNEDAPGSGNDPGTNAENGTVVADPLERPPQWKVGQAWTWSVESAASPDTFGVTTVVISADGSTYDIGTTSATEAAAVYPFHLVGLGTVDANTLAWQAHGNPVMLMRWPIIDGDQWVTDLWSAPDADVFVEAMNVTGPEGLEPGFRSVAYYSGTESVFLVADYSPARGQFVRVATHFGAEVPFTEARLVSERAGVTDVQMFRVTDLARWTASSQDPPGLAPKTFTVKDESDLILMACFLSGAQGHFSATLVAPQDLPISCMVTNAAAGGNSYLHFAEPVENGGAGYVFAAPLGQGSATVEVFEVDIR